MTKFGVVMRRSVLTVAVGFVGKFDVIKRQFLALTNHTHH